MSSITAAEMLITALAVSCLLIFLLGLQKALQRTTIAEPNQKRIVIVTGLAIIAWLILLGVLARQQLFTASGLPPRPFFTVLFGLLIIFALSYTRIAKQLLYTTPLHWLVLFQSFRIAVELLLWYLYQSDVLPKLMTFEGANMDIIAGILSLIASFLIIKIPKQARTIVFVYSIAGLLLLLNTLRAAALTMPSTIQRYPFDERLLRLGQPYFIYLPAVLVVMALGFHILSLRQLVVQSGNRQMEVQNRVNAERKKGYQQ